MIIRGRRVISRGVFTAAILPGALTSGTTVSLTLVPRLLVSAAILSAPAGRSPQEHDIIGNDFHLGSALAILLLPAVLPEFTVNADGLPLLQILIQGFTLPAPKDDIEVIHFVFPLIPVFPAPIYG